jgi:hypothetical protein
MIKIEHNGQSLDIDESSIFAIERWENNGSRLLSISMTGGMLNLRFNNDSEEKKFLDKYFKDVIE